jgi:hypothetical protein
MRDLSFPECYVNTWDQLYKVSGTYYMTPHGNTPIIPIHIGTIEGETFSWFIFTIFMELFLIWISNDRGGYKPTQQTDQPIKTYMSYGDHGYANDINITTSILASLQVQLLNLYQFSKHTWLYLETSKCEATGALFEYGNPTGKANINLLTRQIIKTRFDDGISIKYLPLNKLYKMLSVQII